MNIASFSQSKYKNAATPGDDVALIIPGRVLAVFDGATDPTGASYGGLRTRAVSQHLLPQMPWRKWASMACWKQ